VIYCNRSVCPMFRCFHNEIRALARRALRSPFVSLPSLTFVSAGDVPRTCCGRFRIEYCTQRDNPSTKTSRTNTKPRAGIPKWRSAFTLSSTQREFRDCNASPFPNNRDAIERRTVGKGDEGGQCARQQRRERQYMRRIYALAFIWARARAHQS